MSVAVYYPSPEEGKRQAPGWTGDQTTFGRLQKGKIREAKIDGQDPVQVCPTCGQVVSEVAPPGWENVVKGMKKHPEIENPWALAWSMKSRGAQPRKAEEAGLSREQLAEMIAAQEEMQRRSCAQCAEKGSKKVREARPYSALVESKERDARSSNGQGMMQYRRAREQAAPADTQVYSRNSLQNITEAHIEAAHRFLVSAGRMPKLLGNLTEAQLRACHEAHMRYAANYGQMLGEKRLEELLKRCDEIAGLIAKARERRPAELGTATVTPVVPERRSPAEQTATGYRGQQQERKAREQRAGGQFIGGEPGPTAGAAPLSSGEKAWLGSDKREISVKDVTDAPLRFHGMTVSPSGQRTGPGLERRGYYGQEPTARRNGDRQWTDRPAANERRSR